MAEFPEVTKKLEDAIKNLAEELSRIRSGRVTTALIEDISVDYYGARQPVKTLGTIGSLDARTLVVEPWDKNALEPIQKAILQSPLGIAPIADKDSIRLTLPALNQERREALVKILNQKTEETRIALRRERETAIQRAQKMKEDGEIREDDFFRAKERIQKTVDEFNNEKIKDLRDKKEKEILEV